MKKIIKYPCSKCKRLSDAELLVSKEINERLTEVKFIAECCKTEFTELFTSHDIHRYIQEVI